MALINKNDLLYTTLAVKGQVIKTSMYWTEHYAIAKCKTKSIFKDLSKNRLTYLLNTTRNQGTIIPLIIRR